MRQFFDGTSALWQAEELANKPATGFTGSWEEHGGQESTILSLHNTLCHWGAIILPSGYLNYEVAAGAGGNPYGISQGEARATTDPEYATAVQVAARNQGKRLAQLAAQVATLAPAPAGQAGN